MNNVLCVIESLGQGGAERQLIELALGFKERGSDISFLIYHENPFFNNFLEKAGIPIYIINERNYLIRLLKMRRYIRKGKFNAVLSFLESSNFICELAGLPFRKWKLIVGERSANPNIFKSPRLFIYRYFHLFADYVVANTFANMLMVQRINPFLSRKKCKVIYNIIDFNKWKPKENFLHRRDGKLNILISSSYRYLKNLNGLIEALMLLSAEEIEHLSIKWYGDVLDNSMPEGKEKIKKYGLENVITLLPATSEILKITQETDVVAIFSFYEGFPNAICEGMACSKPVICSSVSDMPLFLKYNENLLFDPSSNDSISKTLRYLIKLNNNELINIGQENYKKAVLLFDKDKILNEYLSLL